MAVSFRLLLQQPIERIELADAVMKNQWVWVESEEVFGMVVVDLTQRCQLSLKGSLIAYGERDLKVGGLA